MADYLWYSSLWKGDMYEVEKVIGLTKLEKPKSGTLIICSFPDSQEEEVTALKKEIKDWMEKNLNADSVEVGDRTVAFCGNDEDGEKILGSLSQFENITIPFSVYVGVFGDEYNEASLWARYNTDSSFKNIEFVDYNNEFYSERKSYYRDADGNEQRLSCLYEKDSWGNYVQAQIDSIVINLIINPSTRKLLSFRYIDKNVDLTAEKVKVEVTHMQYYDDSGLKMFSSEMTPVGKDGECIRYYKKIAGFKEPGYIYVYPEDIIEVSGEEHILKPEAVEKYKKLWAEELKKMN